MKTTGSNMKPKSLPSSDLMKIAERIKRTKDPAVIIQLTQSILDKHIENTPSEEVEAVRKDLIRLIDLVQKEKLQPNKKGA